MLDNTIWIDLSSIENSLGDTFEVAASFMVQSTRSNKRHSTGIAYWNGESVRFIIVTVLESIKQIATHFFWPTTPRQREESIILVDVVSKPAQSCLELPFLIQNVVFELAEEFVVVPVGCIPIV